MYAAQAELKNAQKVKEAKDAELKVTAKKDAAKAAIKKGAWYIR